MMTKEQVEELLAKASEAELMEEARPLASTCLALYERDGWQYMDSAPRDGSEFFAWCMERPVWSDAPRHFADVARWDGKTPHDHIGRFSARSGAIVTRWKPINPPIEKPASAALKEEPSTPPPADWTSQKGGLDKPPTTR